MEKKQRPHILGKIALVVLSPIIVRIIVGVLAQFGQDFFQASVYILMTVALISLLIQLYERFIEKKPRYSAKEIERVEEIQTEIDKLGKDQVKLEISIRKNTDDIAFIRDKLGLPSKEDVFLENPIDRLLEEDRYEN